VVTSLVPAHEHAAFYPEPKEIMLKLVADKASNWILGGQVVGPGEAAKRVDVLATAITFGAKAEDLANLDLAYAPPYNNAMDPLHHAANVIRNKQAGHAKSISPMEVEKKIQDGDDSVILDVRNPEEWAEGILEAPEVMMIPVGALREKADKLPRDKEIIIYCRTSVRAYQAERILENAGFGNVKFMDGSLQAWPYGIKAGPPAPEGGRPPRKK
jgi:rhodanese-related sulfurtransferase